MENELLDIPTQALLCYNKNKGLILPEKVPYIGMGASYFASTTLRYLGVKIFPEIANEYFFYLKQSKQFDNAVFISQSGRTTDVLKCTSSFKEYIAIVNDLRSPLVNQPNLRFAVPIYAGSEWFSSTKTYINTLVTLYLGHGFDIKSIIDLMQKKYPEFETLGNFMGESLIRLIKKLNTRCFILGSGPNIGTALQAALMLTETLKRPFTGMPLSLYEHGFKESAKDSVIIVINPLKSVMYERTTRLIELLRSSDAHVIELCDSEIDEQFSPLTSILPFFFMADYLSVKLGVSIPFQIGNKITES